MGVEPVAAAAVTVRPDGAFSFRLPDPAHAFERVRLEAGLGTLDPRPDLRWADGVWALDVTLPPVHRLEYGVEVTRRAHAPGRSPAAPEHGPRAVLELPGYRRPAWLNHDAPVGRTTAVDVAAEGVSARLWTPAGLADSADAPVLVVQDGGGYVEHGLLTRYLATLAHRGTPARALLVDAAPRERRYGADETYADAVVDELLPAVTRRVATGPVIGVGASLGAVAALHSAWRHPGAFAGLLLQSGAFFTPATDPQEQQLPSWPAIVAFVALVHGDARAAGLPATVITCGTHEENAANNRLLADRLRDVGVAVTHVATADLHNFTCWRDTLDPALTGLLRGVARG